MHKLREPSEAKVWFKLSSTRSLTTSNTSASIELPIGCAERPVPARFSRISTADEQLSTSY